MHSVVPCDGAAEVLGKIIAGQSCEVCSAKMYLQSKICNGSKRSQGFDWRNNFNMVLTRWYFNNKLVEQHWRVANSGDRLKLCIYTVLARAPSRKLFTGKDGQDEDKHIRRKQAEIGKRRFLCACVKRRYVHQ
ncbi:hypothetical protein F443_12399 [Phytophthora nicotianae P1569]|uniref:Uncharacterized protein n=1 Tax=Phytophthora nicotianae P1569 TaxID=1317065 RepID=V9ET47_PHYNI|nr:hypothetical protein F443_12399 [Phytophthora nicotianae P1569]